MSTLRGVVRTGRRFLAGTASVAFRNPTVAAPSGCRLFHNVPDSPFVASGAFRAVDVRRYDIRRFASDGGGSNRATEAAPAAPGTELSAHPETVDEIAETFQDTSYIMPPESDDVPLSEVYPEFKQMSNEELADTSTIPGWNLIHTPPGKLPRGALVGHVVSTKMQKTVNVAVDRYKLHRKYRKRTRYTRKFMAHDEKEVASDGDLVMIVPCHRISKHKHFMLREIVRAKNQL